MFHCDSFVLQLNGIGKSSLFEMALIRLISPTARNVKRVHVTTTTAVMSSYWKAIRAERTL